MEIKKYLDRLGLIYYALIAPPLVLFPMAYLPMKDEVALTSFQGDNLVGILSYLASIMLFVALFFSRRLFKRSIAVIRQDWPLQDKLAGYQKASITFYSLGLLASLLSVMLLWSVKHQLFVACYPILLLVLSLYRPTVQRLIRELPFTKEELSVIKDQGNVVNNVR